MNETCSVTLIILLGVCLIGVSFETKMQIMLLVVLAISLVNYWIGMFIPVSEFQQSRGSVNINSKLSIIVKSA